MFIIGVAGKAGSGKDTIAEILGVFAGATRVAFADPIKQALNAIFGWTMEQWSDREWKERPLKSVGKSPRQLAQTLGTEWGRGQDPMFWVRALEDRLDSAVDLREHIHILVIPDVRFEDEADWVRARGGLMVHVVRPGADGKVGEQNHSSEAGVKIAPGDVRIFNDGAKEELTFKVSRQIVPLLAGRRAA